MRVIRGGFESTLRPETVRELVRGISHVVEVRDQDGLPVVVRVRLSEKGLHIEAWGVRGEREDERRARVWARGNGEVREGAGKPLLALPGGRGKGSRKGLE